MKPKLVPEIVYEEEQFFVVNKPSGYYTHPNHSDHQVKSLVSFFADKMNFPGQEKNSSDNPKILSLSKLRMGVVNRLDKETSGLLIMAKTPIALLSLQELFHYRKITKGYRALVHGHFFEYKKLLTHTLIRDPHHRTRRKVLPYNAPGSVGEYHHYQKNFDKEFDSSNNLESRKCRIAETEVSPITFFKHHTLMEVRIFTGRTHQIRAQLTYEGYPLVGDRLYGGHHQGEPSSLMLCSYFLEFVSPFTGDMVSLKIKLPDYFLNYMGQLDKFLLEVKK